MKIKDIITEIERMPGNEYTGGKKSLRIGAGDKNIQKLPGSNAFVYSTEANHMEDGIIIKLWDSANTTPKPVQMRDEDDYEFDWRLRDWEQNQSEDGPGTLIGKLVLEDVPYFPLKGALQVDTITVDEDYRGQGVAKSLYGVVLSILRRPLLAGRSQTPGGRRNWLSLASVPGVDIKGYVMINEARFENPEWADKDIDTVMGRLGGQYIGPSRPPGIHYFAFDVVPGSGELAPAVRTELSKIYDEHGSRTGLYAIWTGAMNKQGVAEEQLDELFQQGKQNWTWKIKADTEAIAKFTVGDRDYMWMAYSHFRDDKPHKWEIQFRALRKSTDPEKLELYGKTGTGNSAEVMSTAVDITREFLQYYGDSVQQIAFDAKENSRIALYRKMVQRLLPNWSADEDYSPDYGLRFTLTRPKQGVAEGLSRNQDQVRQTLNAWMNQDQQFKDPTQRAGFQAKVWPYIQQNIKTILADKGEKGNGDYPAAPYAAWLLVQHMDAYPQNQIEFYNALKQAIPNHPKIQFLRDRAAVNQWIMKNANNPEYFIKGKALPNPTVNVRNPAMFKDAGIVATSREEALANAEQAGNKLLVAAVQATNAQTQPSYKQGVAEGSELPGDFKLMGQNLFLKNLARNLKQRYPDATVKLSSDRVTAYHNEGDDEALSVMGTEVMDSGYIGVGLDDAFTESFQGVLVPTIKQTTEQLLAANPGTRPALFLSTDNWNPDAWTHIADKLGYRLVADDESLDENFADGKNPGRKGLAKRSGVNTKASVSTLRNVAKHSSGEKARMAHWLANMKAGRAKKK